MATILHVDGTQKPLETVTIKAMQQAIDGIGEVVHIGGGRCLYVHEAGKPLNLPLNLQATDLMPTDDYIVGPVVLCTGSELGLDIADQDDGFIYRGDVIYVEY